ncbi:MAG: hypothetical protein IJ410_04775 [Oscillospiraceae bacterium]|nr:hypothetical protein [Oscillospiraceae bacterium]
MLGNVKPYLPQLSEEDRARYNGFYCGLCKTLGRDHGLFSRFMLNYDMAFVAMLYDELHGESYNVKRTGCFANPFKKKDILIPTGGTAFAADVLVMLAYFKLKDNIADENILKKAGCVALCPYFYLKYRHRAKKHPQLAEILAKESRAQLLAEKSGSDIDRLALPTANMVKAIMHRAAPKEKKMDAGQFGFMLGRVIYLIDALCDRKDDEKENKFNIFNIKKLTDEEAKAECFMALGEMAHWYRKLNITEYKAITDNIIYLSLARKIKFAGEETGDETDNG